MSVKTLPVEENVRKKNPENDFLTVKSLANISNQKWGKKSLSVEEKGKNLENDFLTVKSLDNISTQKWGKNSLPVEGLQKLFQWFIFLFSLSRALTMVCVRNPVSRLQYCYNCKWFTSKWELLSKY